MAEMQKQLDRWGDQTHPNGTSEEHREQCDAARVECDRADKDGGVTWLHILNEEFLEAASEENEENLVKELVQVMAVCGSWLKDIRQKRHPLQWYEITSGMTATVSSGLNHDGDVTGTVGFIDEVKLHLFDRTKPSVMHVYNQDDIALLVLEDGRRYRHESE